MVLTLVPESTEAPSDYRESIRYAGELLQFWSHLFLTTEGQKMPDLEEAEEVIRSPRELAEALVQAFAISRVMNYDVGGALADYLTPSKP